MPSPFFAALASSVALVVPAKPVSFPQTVKCAPGIYSDNCFGMDSKPAKEFPEQNKVCPPKAYVRNLSGYLVCDPRSLLR